MLYPKLSSIYAVSGYSKLKSKNLHLQSRELKVNPDWDEDVIHSLFEIFATNLKWTPPKLPEIAYRVDGQKNKTPLREIKKIGLKKFLKKEAFFKKIHFSEKKTEKENTFAQKQPCFQAKQ